MKSGHAGQFLRLLGNPAPDEDKYYQEGAEEAEEMFRKLQQ